MYKKGHRGWKKHADFLILNLLCLHLSFILSYCLRFQNGKLPYQDPVYLNIAVVLSVLDVLVSLLFNTLHNVLRRGFYQEIASTLKQVMLLFMISTLYLFSVQQSEEYSRIVLYLTMAFYAVINYGARLLWKRLLVKLGNSSARSMLIVTKDALAEEIFTDLKNTHVEIAGFVLVDKDQVDEKIMGVPVVSGVTDAAAYICREWIDEVLVYLPLDDEKPERLIEQCKEMGVTVHVTLDTKEINNQKQFVEKLGNHTVLTSTISTATPLQAFLKRAMDILGGLAGCVLALIAILFVGPKIKKASPGPILFAQERIGKNGRKFKMYKIRSMYLDAEERKKELMKENRVSDGMMFKLDFDPRIIGNEILPDGTKKTGIGETIRKYSLDELPQFWNVLKGDMSLVGTRPPTVDEWEKYELHHRARLAMKPGITGMWQVSGRSNITDFEEVVKLDTQYISNWSMGLDMRILWKTVGAVIGHTGAM
ncbi:MAG: sugar transferase [Clostridia bacterium]|nr:sugar transferase [Clostridia bacterium]